ncbi:MAG: thioredoxin family protein [Verrucomicrobia bacterium]|nr:MAG: thioredoxin family protein [Verrucomicrobiota bacterium]
MKKLFTCLWMATLVFACSSVYVQAKTPAGWITDLEAAKVQAKAENKSILLEFTGSDWCPPCIQMKKNVFSKEAFVEAASKKFILVELDFPKKDKEVSKRNEPLAEKYKIEAFPTVVLVDADGKEFTRFIASEHPTIEAFLKHLDEALAKKTLD